MTLVCFGPRVYLHVIVYKHPVTKEMNVPLVVVPVGSDRSYKGFMLGFNIETDVPNQGRDVLNKYLIKPHMA